MQVWIMKEDTEIRGVFSSWVAATDHASQVYNPHGYNSLTMMAPAFPYPDVGEIIIKSRADEPMHHFQVYKYDVKGVDKASVFS